MRIVVNKDAHISVGQAPQDDSIHIEIGEHRDTLEHIYIHPSKIISIAWLAGGIQLLIK